MYKITYKIFGNGLSATVDNISELYEYVKALIQSNKTMFPKTDETLSEYIVILSSIKDGKTIKHENFMFSVEKVQH